MQGGTPAPAISHDFPRTAARGTRLQAGENPQSCTPPGFVLELLPGKAVQTNPHLTARGEEGISTALCKQELQEVIPEQKQLQLPLQDSSPEPSTQTASVQGRSTALFCWEGKTLRAPGEEIQLIFPKGERWYAGEETQQMGIWRPTPDIYLEYINYIFNSHSLMAYSQLLRYSSGVD